LIQKEGIAPTRLPSPDRQAKAPKSLEVPPQTRLETLKNRPQPAKNPPGFLRTLHGFTKTLEGISKTQQGFFRTLQGFAKTLEGIFKTRREEAGQKSAVLGRRREECSQGPDGVWQLEKAVRRTQNGREQARRRCFLFRGVQKLFPRVQ
jgi:hypothetical protein